MTFRVEWAIDIDDEGVTVLGAAQAAWESMRLEDSIANYFEVSDENDMTTSVDLSTGEVGQTAWVPGPTAVAELAEYMAKEQWDITEIIEMIRRPHKYKDEYSKMLSDRAFDVVAKEPEMEELPDEPVSSVRVSFRPEKWVDDQAVEVTVDWGQFEWNVSEETARAIARQLVAKVGDWDWVRDAPEALKWCKEWSGPFTIEVLADGHSFEQGVWAGECTHCGNVEMTHMS